MPYANSYSRERRRKIALLITLLHAHTACYLTTMLCASNALRYVYAVLFIGATIQLEPVLGFTSNSSRSCVPLISPHKRTCTTRIGGSISKWNEEYKGEDDDEDDDLITNEMFMRDMLSEPAKRRKKGSKEYKPHDNRDALPFVVKVKTPDPYTPTEKMLKQAKQNSEAAKKGIKGGNKKKSNLVGMGSKHGNIAASIYSRKKDGTLYKGELIDIKLDVVLIFSV